ncbi:proline-, glutamic acid- and leucine-rich protein 1-like [Scylla paramamosain]|uniref:proline-, glutamic acid- and leucine-rich protein 1-like n=1 Tax=Scylla paramamosain TaxID=85552 RepID=UPI003082F162
MLKFLVQGGAVPFGYAPDMNGSDPLPCLRHHNPARQDVLPHHAYHYVRDQLPDVILSNTPPSSPLRRTRSCHAFFPDTPPPSPPLPPTPPLTPGTPRTGERATRAEGGNLEQVEMDEPSPPELPELCWPLPPRRHAPREEEEGGQEEQGEEEERDEEQQRRWRYIGTDLRNIADQFQFRYSKALETKSQRRRRRRERREEEVEEEDVEEGREEQGGALSLSIPSALTRCLSASFFLIICWRIVDKLH